MDELFISEVMPYYEQKAVIKVIGAGGAGISIVSGMPALNIDNVEYIAVDSDAKVLSTCNADTCILIGKHGLGTDGRFEKGKEYALESIDKIRNAVKGADMVFITAGMGGGTGTGAASVIAAEAKASGALVIAVVSIPHKAADAEIINTAKEGLAELINCVDSYIVVPNDVMYGTLYAADNIIRQNIQGICDIISNSVFINIDIEDFRFAMQNKGKAFVGTGKACGSNRAKQAFENALKSPLLSDTDIKNANAVLLNISANENDLLMDEVAEIQTLLNEYAGSDMFIIDNIAFDDRTDGTISTTIVATGISGNNNFEYL